MIIYMAGQATEAPRLKYRALYKHVLFSFFAHSKKNFKALKKTRLKEIERKK